MCFTGKNVNAQNLLYIDDRPIHFGFFLGFNTFDFGVSPSMKEINGDKYAVAVSTLRPGFTVGVITDLRLHEYWNLRINPSLQFAERELLYKSITTGETTRMSVTSVPVSVPVYLKYSSQRIGNYRPYLIGGVGGYIDLGRETEKPLLLRPLDFYIEFGVGCDIYFPFFKLAPELKFALGFNDMLVPLNERTTGFISGSDVMYTDALSKLTSRMLTLTFNFE